MKANSTHISLETAKLLKDCEVESDSVFMNTIEGDPDDGWEISKSINGVGEYPAYTWQEILWEYPQKFFGENLKQQVGFEQDYKWCKEIGCKYIACNYTDMIVRLLQQKKYDQADKYFRDNCILIK